MVEYPLLNQILKKYTSVMVLNLFIEGNDIFLKKMYEEAVEKHNENMATNDYPDSGFDIFNPVQIDCVSKSVNKINFGVRCQANMVYSNTPSHSGNFTSQNYFSHNTGFYMYPRSSISKTPLRLANSVGIIDSGYRGSLIGAFDCFQQDFGKESEPWDSEYTVKKYDRLVQICAPTLVPIYVVIMNDMDATNTSRGDGGFGSTGK